jgi:ATP-dependent DNA helicase 2 subunit 1
LPVQVILTKAEAADLKTLRNRGLQLLGFKPLSCLRAFHQVSNAHFLYPDEKSLQGSTAAFTALHTAMSGAGDPQMALARLVRREGDMPVLVALVAQEERVEEGAQV